MDTSEKDKLKHLFGNFIAIDELNSKNIEENGSFKSIYFVLILLKEENTQSIKSNAKNIIELAQRHQGMIETISATFISILFNVPVEQKNSEELYCEFIKSLSIISGNKLSVVYGQCESYVGTIGSSERMSYTALIPNFKDKLYQLSSLEFGHIKEIKYT
ncbi:hypothetical protein ACFL35_19490 [Candidatus Riflebacteria bacterium]